MSILQYPIPPGVHEFHYHAFYIYVNYFFPCVYVYPSVVIMQPLSLREMTIKLPRKLFPDVDRESWCT